MLCLSDSEDRKEPRLRSPYSLLPLPQAVSWDPGWAGARNLKFPKPGDARKGMWGWMTELRILEWATSKWAEDTSTGPCLAGDIIFPGFLSGQMALERKNPFSYHKLGLRAASNYLPAALQMLLFPLEPVRPEFQSPLRLPNCVILGHVPSPQCFHL